MSAKEWVNNIARMFKSKNGNYFLTIPLAEPVTIVLQRKTKEGFVDQKVTLMPDENEKGYKSVRFLMTKPESYTKRDGTVVDPPESLKFECALPPQNEGDGESDF